MKRLVTGLLIAVFFTVGCGEDTNDSFVLEAPVVNATLVIAAGSSVSYAFPIDLTVMEEPYLIGGLGSITEAGTAGNIRVLVMTDENYALWDSGEEYVSLFDSGLVSSEEFEIPMTATDTFRLVFSNREDASAGRTVDTVFSVLFTPVEE